MKTKIGILSALDGEIESIQKYLKSHSRNVEETRLAGRIYQTTSIQSPRGPLEVVSVVGGWGKVASAVAATTLLAKFNVEQLLFWGVAGSCSRILKPGDVVIGDRCMQYDVDARPFVGLGELPFVGRPWLELDVGLSEELSQVAGVAAETLRKDPRPRASIALGPIVSGDQFLSRLEQGESLLQRDPSILAADMESAAVAQVCAEFGVPFGVVRVISDRIGLKPSESFRSFLSQWASPLCAEMFKQWIYRT
ncbi:MAG TPA: 5'-methylthioadenosine/adenosylhomocysteine nucleosidase [Oligoflexia bacterium]|nr:5'-methylthioadenosine/adenosylhomocysteine nucleosidase [Oligoflexia bacterium]